MAKSTKIITVTMNPAIDMEAEVDMVVPEKKMRCGQARRDPGGGGINVSRVIKRLGGNTAAYYLAGGNYGNHLEELVRKEDITSFRFSTETETRENLVFSEAESSRQFRFLMAGGRVKKKEYQALLDEISKSRNAPEYVIASGSLPLGVSGSFFEKLSGICSRMGSRLVIDTSGVPMEKLTSFDVFLLKPNRNEFRQLVGRKVEDLERQRKEALKIIKKGKVKIIVISLGHRGALVVSRDLCEHIQAPQVMVKSIVGAGDSMTAGIIFSLSRKKSLREAVRFGVACGTAAVLTPGTELCKKKDAEKMYRKIKKEDRKNNEKA